MTIESLKIDVNDDLTFKHLIKGNNMGINEKPNEHTQFFFNKEGREVDLMGLYRGRSAFLICNGPSFASLNQDLLTIPGIITFGINNGAKTFRPNMWTCVDDPSRFLKSIWLDSKIMKFIPMAHFDKPIFDNETWEMMKTKAGECPNVLGYRRNEKFNAETFLKEPTLNWGCHKDYGGGRSVMLPSLRILFLLGFRKIYLLGCDMKMSETYTYHFDEQRSNGAVNGNMSTYDRLKHEYLPSLKPIFDAEGFQVFNCNQDSELKVFPFVSFSDAINDATKELGNIKDERVWGLYSSAKEKSKWKKEPSKEEKAHLKTIEALSKGEKPVFISSAKPKKNKPEQNKITSSVLSSQLKPIITPFVPPQSIGHGEITVIRSNIIKPQTISEPKEIQQEDGSIRWNPFNKVVLDHKNGSVDITATNIERTKRGLIIPWTPEIGKKEAKEPPVQ